jgi:hypothetical protein
MIVAFPESDEVAVILVGRHIERRPETDVYRRLYDSLGIDLPTITQRQDTRRAARPASRLWTATSCTVSSPERNNSVGGRDAGSATAETRNCGVCPRRGASGVPGRAQD